jgi:hypothetical protein
VLAAQRLEAGEVAHEIEGGRVMLAFLGKLIRKVGGAVKKVVRLRTQAV